MNYIRCISVPKEYSLLYRGDNILKEIYFNKRKLLSILSICLIAILAISMIDSINAATISPDKSDRLQEVIDNAKDGDTITLKNGVYTIDKPIEIVNKGKLKIKGESSNVVLDGKNKNAILKFVNYPTGGELTLENLKFINGKDGFHGGAVSFGGAKLTVTKCTFQNNQAPDSAGAISFNTQGNPKGSFTVDGSTFKNNKVTGSDDGGAIHVLGNVLVKITNSKFEGNTARSGGAVYYGIGSQLLVSGCTFTKNKASEEGGAISYSGNDPNSKITNSKFNENSANRKGGAIYSAVGSKITVSGCTFTKNKVTNKNFGSGGAVFFDLPLSDKIKGESVLINSKFTENSASLSGGAVSYSGGKQSKFTITGCTFTKNKATHKSYGFGGAIVISGKLKTSQITNSKFTNNIAGKRYNAIFKVPGMKISTKNVKITPKEGTKAK